jgi:hypothetical protein
MDLELVEASAGEDDEWMTSLSVAADEDEEYGNPDRTCRLAIIQQPRAQRNVKKSAAKSDEMGSAKSENEKDAPTDKYLSIDLTPDAALSLAAALSRWVKRRRKRGEHV